MSNRLSLRPESAWALNFARKDLQHAGEICDVRKRAHFEANLWKSDTVPLSKEDMCAFEEQLYNSPDMETKLGLFLMPEFFPHLKALDLGESMNPANGRDLRKVEEEYESLRQKLIDQDVIDGELSRPASLRTIHIDAELAGGALLGTRNRRLFLFEEQDTSVLAHKQTSFLISPNTLDSMAQNNGLDTVYDTSNYGRLHLSVVEAIEAAIDTHDPSVYPVRTHFFVKAG